MNLIIDFDVLCDKLRKKEIKQFYYVSSHKTISIIEPNNKSVNKENYGFYIDIYIISYYDGTNTKIIGYIILHDTSLIYDYCAIKGVFTTCNYVEFTIRNEFIYYLNFSNNVRMPKPLGAMIDKNIHDSDEPYDIRHLINQISYQ